MSRKARTRRQFVCFFSDEQKMFTWKAPLWKMGQRHKPQSSAKTKIKTESLFSPLLTISYQVEGSLCLVKARLISLGFPLIRSFGI
ncbi:unnamed protein product [Allacma fusca]|uniref:Uncharacterized protein n=1 Tax=Allacma fusca TaxID=39272 RepID=A0A8J2Q587_9HEXA|nr:unnamed protein product [Allacma fusca]